MWELIVPLVLFSDQPMRPLQWIPEVVERRTVTLGPFPSREECQRYRRALIARARATDGPAGNEPPGYDPQWAYWSDEVGACAEVRSADVIG